MLMISRTPLSGARIANIPNLGTVTKADASCGMKQELMYLMMGFAITGSARKVGEVGMTFEQIAMLIVLAGFVYVFAYRMTH